MRRGIAQVGGAVEGFGFGVAGVVARVVVRAEQARFLRPGHGGGTLGTIGGVGGDVGIGAVVGETTVGRDLQVVVQAFLVVAQIAGIRVFGVVAHRAHDKTRTGCTT